MEIGELQTLKALSIQAGSVYRMRLFPDDGVVPKHKDETSRDKFFIILGKDAGGNIVALSLINTEINEHLKSRIGEYQYPIASADYAFLHGKDRFVDCYSMKEVSMKRIMESGDYIGIISDADLDRIIALVGTSPIISVATLKKFSLYKGEENSLNQK